VLHRCSLHQPALHVFVSLIELNLECCVTTAGALFLFLHERHALARYLAASSSVCVDRLCQRRNPALKLCLLRCLFPPPASLSAGALVPSLPALFSWTAAFPSSSLFWRYFYGSSLVFLSWFRTFQCFEQFFVDMVVSRHDVY
jgi:hypothetical protein